MEGLNDWFFCSSSQRKLGSSAFKLLNAQALDSCFRRNDERGRVREYQ